MEIIHATVENSSTFEKNFTRKNAEKNHFVHMCTCVGTGVDLLSVHTCISKGMLIHLYVIVCIYRYINMHHYVFV